MWVKFGILLLVEKKVFKALFYVSPFLLFWMMMIKRSTRS